MISEQEIVARLRLAVIKAGGQSAFAALHGISHSYISDVLANRRDPGPRILDALGYEKVVLYRKQELKI